MKIKKIRKRDGRIVDFDQSKITSAIYKAAEAVGKPDVDLAKRLSNKVIELLKGKKIPSVEEIQDIVEKVLMSEGEARIAKAYILYRQKRAEIRKEKQKVLNKTEIDSVDKKFDINALKVLSSRYLKKDNAGRIIETPKELFERVAVHTALASLFFDKRIFDKRGKSTIYPKEEFDEKKWVGKLKIGNFILNQFHLEALKRLYDRFNKKRQMKVSWTEFLELLKRGEFKNLEAEIQEFYNVMTERKFLPNTPTLANFGNYLGMGSACFVLGIFDSIESIMETLKQASIIFKAGGGAGYNFSKLRPEGDFVKTTGGVASGPISFMTLFDRMTEVIKQGGIRRGANIGILNSNHPDIEKFIVSKKENKALTNFNISVFIDSDFWKYLKENKPYPLINPRTNQVTKYIDPKNLLDLVSYQIWESAEPGVIFGDIVNKYNPFLDTLGKIEATNPCVTGDTLVAVADGRNYVPIKQLAEEARDVPVYCFGDGRVQIRMGRNPRKTRENVCVWKVILDDGTYITATYDHKFRDINNNEIELKDLKPGTKLMPFYKFQYRPAGKRTSYWGISQNNGERAKAEHRMVMEFYLDRKIKKYPQEIIHHKNENGLDNRIENLEIMVKNQHDSFHQIGERNVMKGKWWNRLSDEEKELYRRRMSKKLSGKSNPMFGKVHRKSTIELISERVKEFYSENPEIKEILRKKSLDRYQKYPELKRIISKRNTVHIPISSSCLNCGKTIIYKPYKQRIFCSLSCRTSYINHYRDTTNLRRTKEKKREQKRESLYRIGLEFLSKYHRLPKYKEFCEFVKKQYQYSGDVRSTFDNFTNFKEQLSLSNHEVKEILFSGYQDVYNITVDEFHTVAYVTNPNSQTKISKRPLISGIITSQCGEVLLYPYESCNLGSINLWAFVKETPTNGGKRKVEFDWDEFSKTISIAVRFLDNVVEVNKYPLPEIEEMTLNTRKIGLGVMGLGNLLYDLEIPYNSPEGLNLMEKIMEFLNFHSKLASIKLARERQRFPYYNKSFYPKGKLPFSGFEQRDSWNLDWDMIRRKIKKYGLRNAYTTVIAPTGSISMIAGCSSGIEPVFSLVFEKRVTVGSFYYIDPVFEKIMLREGLFDEDLIRQTAENSGSIQNLTYIPNRLKRIFVISLDMKAEDHIKALAAFQKWTDSSISKTINLKHDVTIEDIKESIFLAHQLQCKDLTMYRDKSIRGVLIAGARKKKEKKEEILSFVDTKAKGPAIYFQEGVSFEDELIKKNEICPNCESSLVREESCLRCPSCGWSVCSL